MTTKKEVLKEMPVKATEKKEVPCKSVSKKTSADGVVVNKNYPNFKVTDNLKKDLMNQPASMVSTADKKIYQTAIKGINSELEKAEKCYLNIAFKLHKIYSKKLYAIDNFQNIYDFAESMFHLAKGTCNNYINIVERFGDYSSDEKNVISFTGKLKPEYEKFSSSKLIAMLGLPENILRTISPDMTVREIKEIKREYKDGMSAIEDKQKIVDSTAKIIDDESEEPEESEVLGEFELNSGEKEMKSIRVAIVDNILSLSPDIQDVIGSAYADFKEKYPNRKASFDIRLIWD